MLFKNNTRKISYKKRHIRDKLPDDSLRRSKRKTTADVPTLGNDSIIGSYSQRAQELFDLRESKEKKEAVNISPNSQDRSGCSTPTPLFLKYTQDVIAVYTE